MDQAVKFFPVFASVLLAAGVFSGCAGRRVEDKPGSFMLSRHPADVERVWSKKLPGPITDLSLSRNGNALLIATIPDADAAGSNAYLLTRMDAGGKTVWRLPLKSQIKAQAISEDGSLVVTSNYNSELSGIGANGKVLWTVEASCRPIILSHAKKVLCHHDDDTLSEIAFEVFDWNGKKLLSFPIRQDILSLKVSADEKNVAMGLVGGKILVLNDAFKTVWEATVKGEILDLAVSSGPKSQVAVLHHSLRDGQAVSLFDSGGILRGTAASSESGLGLHVEQIEIAPGGGAVYVYGNSPKGQYLARFITRGPPAVAAPMVRSWERVDPRYADYSSTMVATDHAVMIGFEDVQDGARKSHLLAFDPDGKLSADVHLVTEEGAYLYSYAFSAEKSVLAAGTDDSTLGFFRLVTP